MCGDVGRACGAPGTWGQDMGPWVQLGRGWICGDKRAEQGSGVGNGVLETKTVAAENSVLTRVLTVTPTDAPITSHRCPLLTHHPEPTVSLCPIATLHSPVSRPTALNPPCPCQSTHHRSPKTHSQPCSQAESPDRPWPTVPEREGSQKRDALKAGPWQRWSHAVACSEEERCHGVVLPIRTP